MAARLLAAAALALLLGSAAVAAQDAPGARWIPTETNYATISTLLADNLTSPTAKIAGYGTLGVIPTADVAAWLEQLTSNPSFREGTVRWQPGVPSKCASGTLGCTKSIRISVLEYRYDKIDASDCKASALVAADAILPRQALLTDGSTTFLPPGPVQYQIVAAPNSSADACTYVVQYPPPTQILANQLCATSGACFNSSCQPCAANQTVTGGDTNAGCSAASGISPALVAAIQGAALCLGAGPLGRLRCTVDSGLNASACAQMACFPGDATVQLAGGGRRRMRELRLGDRVRVVRPDGSLGFDEIYFFGHRDAQAAGAFVSLELRELGGGGGRAALRLSGKHFLPVGPAWARAVQTRAADVRPGDVAWAEAGGKLRPHAVASRRLVTERGLWAPYTAAGSLLVDGVAASVHSEWHLDAVFDALGRPDLLPTVYQALLWPVRALYAALGPEAMRALDARLDPAAWLNAPLAAYKPCLAALPAAVAAAALSRRLR